MCAKSPPRRAAVLAAVLVCLAVCSAIVVALLAAGVRQRRQVELQERRAKAWWLAEAGIERAAARLATDENYSGEDWQLGRDELGLPTDLEGSAADAGPAAIVHIEVRAAVDGRGRQISVRADVPPELPRRARREHTVLWTPQPGDRP